MERTLFMNGSEKILQIFLDAIKKKDITEKECLISSNVNTSFFTDWKNRKSSKPAYDKVVAIANYLGIDLNYLFNDEDTSFAKNITDNEKQMITYYRSLSDFERGNLYGELRLKYQQSHEEDIKKAE